MVQLKQEASFFVEEGFLFDLTFPRHHKTLTILFWLTPDYFTRQGESSRREI